MAGEKYRVKYVDSNGDTQVLAQNGTNNSDSDLDKDATATADRLLITRSYRGFSKAKIWCDSSIIGNVPLKNGSYDKALNSQSEPEILVEEWTGSSWDRIFRGFAKSKPSSKSSGQALLVLKGFGRYTGKQDVSYDTNGTTTSIDTILENTLPNGYTVDAAAGSEWPSGSVPTAENYSFNGERQVAYRELSKNYDASIEFTSDLSSGNYVVKLEPVGSGGTVDTIYSSRDLPSSSDTLGEFREWSGGNVDQVINKAEVIGTDSTGSTVTGTASDSTSISDYGTKFVKKNVPYVDSNSEADSIAQNLLQAEPTKGGVVKTPRYTQRVINSSFQLESSENNVSGVYTAVKTRNLLHEQAVELIFEYETGSEAQAENQVETTYERSQIYPNSDKTPSTSANISRTTDAATSDSTRTVKRDPNTGVNGVVTNQGYFFGNYSDTPTTDGTWTAVNNSVTNDSKQYLFHAAFFNFEFAVAPTADTTAVFEIYARLYNVDTGTYFPSSSGVELRGSIYLDSSDSLYNLSQAQYLHAPFNWKGDTYRLEYNIEDNGRIFGTPSVIYSYHGSEGHDHNDGIQITDEFGVNEINLVDGTSIGTQPDFSDDGHSVTINVTEVDQTDR